MDSTTFKGHRFYKKERLCSKIDIDRLFAPRPGGSVNVTAPAPAGAVAYPWRAVWLPASESCKIDFPRVLVMVPKRRLRHAVDRVTMRRRMREAYRLSREILPTTGAVDIAFIYVADKLTTYDCCCRSVRKLFNQIQRSLTPSHDNTTPNPVGSAQNPD